MLLFPVVIPGNTSIPSPFQPIPSQAQSDLAKRRNTNTNIRHQRQIKFNRNDGRQ